MDDTNSALDICSRNFHKDEVLNTLDGMRHSGCDISHCLIIFPTGVDKSDWFSFVFNGTGDLHTLIVWCCFTDIDAWREDPGKLLDSIPSPELLREITKFGDTTNG